MLLLRSDITFGRMVELELNKSSEFKRVGQEETEHLSDFTHRSRRQGGRRQKRRGWYEKLECHAATRRHNWACLRNFALQLLRP